MNGSFRDKTKSNPAEKEIKLWLPPLSPKDQKKLKRLRKKTFSERIGFKDKTLWDWLGLLALLAVPLVVAGATLFFTQQQAQLSDAMNKQQHQTDLQIAANQQQEATLQDYMDRISDLLLHDQLRQSKPGDEVRNVARARTLITLPRLDGIHKGILIQFLNQAQLISTPKSASDYNNPIISLLNADLRGIKLIGTVAFFDLSLLSNTQLPASIGNTDIQSLSFIYDIKINPSKSIHIFVNIDCSGASGPPSISLNNVRRNSIDISGIDLRGTDLSNALIRCINLQGADMSYANLTGAEIFSDNLSAINLQGTVMPDGSTVHS